MISPSEFINENNFRKFGTNFQLTALSLFVQEHAFAQKIKHIIKPEYFNTKYLKWICAATFDYMDQYGNPPSFDTLKTLTETQVDPKSVESYLSALDDIKETNLKDKKFVEEVVFDFCSYKYAKSKLDEAQTRLEIGDLLSAQQLTYEAFKPIESTARTLDLKKDYKEIFTQDKHSPIPTPLEELNMVCKGGPGKGDLAIVVAPAGFGKTSYLLASARKAAQEGFNVAYFSLETKLSQLVTKTLAGLINIEQQYLEEHSSLLEHKVNQISGNVKLTQYKATEATIARIASGVEEMKRGGFFPDMICVDGLNQLKLPASMKRLEGDDNKKFEYLCEELRDMAGELQVVLYSAFQCNRKGMNTEFNDEQAIGKAIEPIQVADWMVIFSQTDEQQESNECRIRLLKNRLGKKGLVLKLSYDSDKGTFRTLETENVSMLRNKQMREDVKEGLTKANGFMANRKGRFASCEY